MSRIDNGKYYDEVVSRHGDSAQGVHWNSQKMQYKRFEVLLGLLDLDANSSIVDVGCGFGALNAYLNEKEIAVKSYLGLEVMDSMVEVAQCKGVNVQKCDVLADPLPKADYYICSGAMNILTRDETNLFIERCLKASNKGFVFNMLEGADESMVYNYYDPNELKQMANVLDVRHVMKKGYIERDFTVFLEKRKGNG